MEEGMSVYARQQLAVQRQNLADEESVQRSLLVSGARREFTMCQSVSKSLRDECSQFVNQLQKQAHSSVGDSGLIYTLRHGCQMMLNEYPLAMTSAQQETLRAEARPHRLRQESRAAEASTLRAR